MDEIYNYIDKKEYLIKIIPLTEKSIAEVKFSQKQSEIMRKTLNRLRSSLVSYKSELSKL